jgi:hypothetical protein
MIRIHAFVLMSMAASEQVFIHPVGPVRSTIAAPVRYQFCIVTAFVLWSDGLTDGLLVSRDDQVKLYVFCNISFMQPAAEMCVV